MASSKRGFKRTVRRCQEELRATWEIARYTSIMEAAVTFFAKVDIQWMNRNGFRESPSIKKRLLKKHEVMLKYFEKKLAAFLEAYPYDREPTQDRQELRNRIWLCWWQGIEQAPQLVRKCIESVYKNAGAHTVTLITEQNYKEYIEVPQWMEDKYHAGKITTTNYSDFLRLSLLAQYGGLWLDATFFCKDLDLTHCFGYKLWSIKRPEYFHVSVACGRFAGYSLACAYENRWIFATIRDFFLHYWQEADFLVDYLLIDYMITLAQKKNPRIAEAFRGILPNNPNCDELAKVLAEPYDPQVWETIKQDTYLFKLTWKQSFPTEKNGQKTFYGMLIDGLL